MIADRTSPDDPIGLWRIETTDGIRWARGPVDTGPEAVLDFELDSLLAASAALDDGLTSNTISEGLSSYQILTPLEHQEVWVAGTTACDRDGSVRVEEAQGASYYGNLFPVERPALAYVTNRRAEGRASNQPIYIRAGAGRQLPDPKLGLVINARGVIVAYTVGNHVTSRSIEGRTSVSPLRTDVQGGDFTVGQCLVPIHQAPRFEHLEIRMSVERGNWVIYSNAAGFSSIRLNPMELVDRLFREQKFPNGVVLLFGASIVPPDNFSLASGDMVTVFLVKATNSIAAVGAVQIGTLRNTVAVV